MSQTIKIGTRGSELALWQARHVADLLREQYPDASVELNVYTTKGDTILDRSLPEIGGKGLFTEELERALLAGEIDCAVHSLKDLPTENPKGLTIGAVPKRGAVNDVLISKHGLPLDKLPAGAKIGTSSLRRSAQLRHFRPDFEIIDLRGNVPTRINKALDANSPYDAIVLAQAGVERLGFMDKVSQIIPLEIMLPAPAQGAIAVQCLDSAANVELFSKIEHKETLYCVMAERGFLNELGAGCSAPVAAYYFLQEGISTEFEVIGGYETMVLALDGQTIVRLSGALQKSTANVLRSDREHLIMSAELGGILMAHNAQDAGARKILAEVKK
jgi:hydroxymethylbilane synthase